MRLVQLFAAILFFLSGTVFAQIQTELPCAECHSPEHWKPLNPDRSFDHTETDFPLEFAHQSVACDLCHTDATNEEFHRFRAPGTECVDCHIDVHNTNLGTDCERCHSPTEWTGFNKRELHDETLFPLTGVHLAVDCIQCHGTVEGQTWTGTPVECEECHIEDYQHTTAPSHTDLDFTTRCDECHFTIGWQPAYANHEQFGLLLESVHSRMNCADCHANFDFNLQDCYTGCHEPDYSRGHEQQNYLTSHDCYLCHTTGTWGFGNHDILYFPIFSGEHRGTWNNDCTICHINDTDFTDFTCGLNGVCHEHEKSKMDDEHRGEASGYVYNSDDCYTCHPNGTEDD